MAAEKDPLSHLRRLEESAVGIELGQLHFFLLRQNIQPDFQGGKGRQEVRPHKVSQVQSAVRTAGHQRASLIQAQNRLSGIEIAADQPPAIRAPSSAFRNSQGIQLSRLLGRTDRLRKFLKQRNPRVDVRSAVVAVYHGDGNPRGRCHHVNFPVYRHFTVRNQHCEI